MCLLGIAFHIIPGHPVFLIANREESPHRPTAGPAITDKPPGKTNWLGGMDLEAGGTWLGLNQRRLIVAVTNRNKTDVSRSPRSRGLLCRDLLGMPDIESATSHARQQLRTGNYAGCNFLLASPESAVAIEAGDEIHVSPLTPGIHLMANGDLNDPLDPRIRRAPAGCLRRSAVMLPKTGLRLPKPSADYRAKRASRQSAVPEVSGGPFPQRSSSSATLPISQHICMPPVPLQIRRIKILAI